MPTPTRSLPLALLTAALATCLCACSSSSTKPDVPPWAIPDVPGEASAPKPLPPRVDCSTPRPPDSALPPNPTTDDGLAWSVWASRVYGYIKLWVGKADADDGCLAALREKGVIR